MVSDSKLPKLHRACAGKIAHIIVDGCVCLRHVAEAGRPMLHF